MGFSSTVCYRNEVGKILAKLRVDFGESQTRQAERLGYNASFLSLVSSDRRGFSYDLYKSIMEHYAPKATLYKNELQAALIKENVRKRFLEVFPNATAEQMIYVLYGIKE